MSSISISLGEICSLITDGKHGDCKNEDDSGFFFISAKDIKDGRIHYENARQIIYEDFLETHRRTNLQPGDILLTNSGTIGRLAIAPDEEITYKTTFQKSVAILKPILELINSKYLYYFLLKNQTRLENAARGAAQKNLLLSELRRFNILVPSKDVQNSIVSYLSPYDDLIENNRRRIQLLEEAARLLYQEWFVRLRFPGHEHTKIVDGVPEGWRKKTLGETTVLNYGKALKEENRIPGPIPVYGSSGIVGYHEKPLVEGPGIIIGRKGNVGSVFWADSDFHPIDTVYYVNKEETSFFLYYALSNISFVNTDVAVPGLNRTYAYSRTIMWPNATIMEMFDSFMAPIHTQISLLKKNIDSVVKARDLLLPRLMNGVIPV